MLTAPWLPLQSCKLQVWCLQRDGYKYLAQSDLPFSPSRPGSICQSKYPAHNLGAKPHSQWSLDEQIINKILAQGFHEWIHCYFVKDEIRLEPVI